MRTDSEVPKKVDIMLGNVRTTIQICDDSSITPSVAGAVICISLQLDEDTIVRFAEPIVKLELGSIIPKNVAMSSVEYEIFCQFEKDKKRCTSTEALPIIGDVKIVSTKGMLNRYAFDPSLEFRGAKDTLHEGAWFGHRLKGKRLYYIRTVSIPIERAEDISVQLPDIIINQKIFKPPKLNFRMVTEDICRTITLA